MRADAGCVLLAVMTSTVLFGVAVAVLVALEALRIVIKTAAGALQGQKQIRQRNVPRLSSAGNALPNS